MKLDICLKIVSNPCRKPASNAACTKRYYMININVHTNANVNFRTIIIKILAQIRCTDSYVWAEHVQDANALKESAMIKHEAQTQQLASRFTIHSLGYKKGWGW